MRPISSFKAWACAAALALLPSAPVLALSYQMMDDADLLAQARGAALFEVVQVAKAAPGDSQTRYLLAWQRGFAGQPAHAYEWLALPGAESETHQHIVDGVPQLEVGQQWLLFYARRADGVLQPVQLTLGLFRRLPNADGDIYLRTVDLHHSGDEHSGDEHGIDKLHNARFAAPRDAAGFERWLAGMAKSGSAEQDYLLDPMPEAMPKYTFMMFNFSTPRPARWFEFDGGGTVSVRAGGEGQNGTVHDEFRSLQRAIDAWNNDPGSRIALRWAGTGSSTADSAVNIRWNDPNDEIAGSFDCSRGGVLGIGGSSASTSQLVTMGGYQWARRLRGFVVIQDGAGCWMDRSQGANGAELLAHELGHVLALGHSCGDGASGSCDTSAKQQALLRASVHGDGRGAALGSDDRAGIAVPYPAPAATRPVLVLRSGFETGS
jgi:hypothetical protein